MLHTQTVAPQTLGLLKQLEAEPTRQAEISYAVFCLKKKTEQAVGSRHQLENNISDA